LANACADVGGVTSTSLKDFNGEALCAKVTMLVGRVMIGDTDLGPKASRQHEARLFGERIESWS
jgi:hypothetical protein